ncbi:N-formylglutamate deformylase [Rhodoferax sp.]|jgi:N-formylglutamate deformylase|uniref:N-formylglutamate deformylase n=1 Tax=Rhodoferax sp. TaxID=50421 RepID=UPI00378458CA
MAEPVFSLHQGSTPLLISLPHVGTQIPSEQTRHYTERALRVEDTDWHLEALYAFAKDLGASMIVPRYSRYLIDLNRPSDNTPMYAGANNTELCPTRFFTGEPLYQNGMAPDATEIARRTTTYWQPYRSAIDAELTRIQAAHGHAVLFDGHSIQSELPWLFEGTLPDLNLGTAEGKSAAPSLCAALTEVLQSQSDFTHVVDGRFKGGHITRHYGRPAAGWHAVQLEMCWKCYMAEQPPYAIDPARAQRVTPVLRALVHTLIGWRP